MTFKKKLFLVFLAFSSLYSEASEAKIKVLVTLPDFIEIVNEIGADRVEADSFLDGTEDPHFVDAIPSFINKAARADVVCAVGLDLEIGWLPKVLSKSGNAKIQQGGPGFCEVSKNVQVLDKATGAVNRSMGDVHAGGNPHYHLSPTQLIAGSKEILRILKTMSPHNSATFERNAKNFESRMSSLKTTIALKLQLLKSRPLIQFHKEFSYFFDEYGLTSNGAIEEKPGVPPSSARIAQISQEAKSQDVLLAVGALHTPSKHLEKFTEISGIPHIKVSAGVQKFNKDINSIEKLQRHLAEELLENGSGKSK